MGAGGVSSPPREAQSCQGYSRNIVMWGERGEAKLASLYVHYTYTLKQLTLAKLQGFWGYSATTVDQQPGRVQSPTGGSGTAKLSSTAQ